MIRLRQLRCSFCRKRDSEVLKLVAGPRVYICDACVSIATRLMNDTSADNHPPSVEPSGWRKLVRRIRQFIQGGDAQRVASSIPSS